MDELGFANANSIFSIVVFIFLVIYMGFVGLKGVVNGCYLKEEPVKDLTTSGGDLYNTEHHHN